MTDEEWETALKSMNDGVRKWVNEEIDKINTYCFYPVHPKYEPIYKAYNDHMSMFWRPSEI